MQRYMTILLVILVGYLILSLSAFVFQSHLVYFPDRSLVADPGTIGLAFEEAVFESDDGISLHGWWIPADEPRAILLFFHGNAGNISHRLESIALFHDLGLSTFIFDYRGYGRSGGGPTEEGLYRDARAAWAYLTEIRGFDPESIVLFGRSLGAAAAIELATKVGAGALVIESAFTSIPEIGAKAYWWLPVKLLARIRFDSRRRVADLRCPLLVVHSPDDEIIPFEMGRRLFDAAPEPKSFLEIRGSHNDGFLTSGEAYVLGLNAFLEERGF